MTTREAHWYVAYVQSGREERVREKLMQRIKADGLDERVPQVVVPVERVTEVKAGKKRVSNRKIYPGYVLIQADLGEEDPDKQTAEDKAVWFALRETPGFRDFVGGSKHPAPMSQEEVDNILGRMQESESAPRMAVKIKRGDMVRIKEGPFEGFDGHVEDVLDGKGLLRISVTIFGRNTSVEIEHWQVEPV